MDAPNLKLIEERDFRLTDIGEARFWRIDPTTDCRPLNGLARQKVNTGLIHDNWDDLLRVVGSLKQDRVEERKR
jgi:TnpA family transposase